MTTTTTPPVRQESLENGRVWRLVLDRPRGNVIDREMVAELRSWAARARAKTGLLALILDHAGEHFSFGASVEEHVRGSVERFLPEFHALARELVATDLPLFACLRGQVLGGGLELALLADRRFARRDARLGQPEIALGVFAPLGSALLPWRVGPQHAARMLLGGGSLEAEEARGIGLVDQIDLDPTTAALEWVRTHLSGKSAAALRLATRAARRAWSVPALGTPDGNGGELARLEREYLEELLTTHDANEGIAAFLAKRKPVWEDA